MTSAQQTPPSLSSAVRAIFLWDRLTAATSSPACIRRGISLKVGIVVVTVSAIVGTLFALWRLLRGWIDRFISGYVFNVFLAFPGLLLAIAMVAFLGAGLNKLIFALCIIGWLAMRV